MATPVLHDADGSKILEDLTSKQREAVIYPSGPLMIVAGPGSGKTLVMTRRVAWLISNMNTPPWKILAVTFTNKSARELQDRCASLLGEVRGLKVSTFHGFGVRVLRSYAEFFGRGSDFSIYDANDQLRTVKGVMEQMDISTKTFPPRKVISMISNYKNRMNSPSDASTDANSYMEEIGARIFEVYQERLDRENAVDFDDLLLKCVQILEMNEEVRKKLQDRFDYVLVDEFQDTNPLQFRLSRLLAEPQRNICVVGDPDQSIYSWRHANPANLEEFKSIYPNTGVVILEHSFRSTRNILNAANVLISHNTGRLKKNLRTDNGIGSQIVLMQVYDEDDEAEMVMREIGRLVGVAGISRNEIAVMYRTNSQSRALEHACRRRGEPYRLIGGVGFYEREEIRDLTAYLRVIANSADGAALERIINKPARGIGRSTVAKLQHAALAKDSYMLDVVISSTGNEGLYALDIGTRALKSLTSFADLMSYFIKQSEVIHVDKLLDEIIKRTGYMKMIEDNSDESEQGRKDNIEELLGLAQAHASSGASPRESLTSFLEEAALFSHTDSLNGSNAADAPSETAITLITLHQAKGLEFDVVFIVGMIEGLLPHSRSIEEDSVEEERRLCYVGISRARRHLYLSHTFTRRTWGWSVREPSRFLKEIPPEIQSDRQLGSIF